MIKMRWLRKWRLAAACSVTTLGVVAIHLGGLNANPGSSGYAQAPSRWLAHSESTRTAWDRYSAFGRTYQRVLSLCPDPYSIDDFITLGPDRLLNQQDVAEAVADLRQMLQITPEQDVGWSDLAWLDVISGDTNNAVLAEQKAISLYPYDYTYYVLLGAFYEQSQRSDEAKAAYGHALVLSPRLEVSHFWRELQRSRPALAAAALQVAMATFDQEESSRKDLLRNEGRARLLFESGKIGGAQPIIDSINGQIENLSGVWELQGEVHEKEKRWDDAVMDYERASFLDKSDPLPHERLATVALHLKRIDMANNEASQAWWLASRQRSPSSARETSEFQRSDGLRDGLLPGSLFRETQPSFDFASIFSRLAAIYATHGADEQARALTNMARRAGTSDDLYGPNNE